MKQFSKVSFLYQSHRGRTGNPVEKLELPNNPECPEAGNSVFRVFRLASVSVGESVKAAQVSEIFSGAVIGSVAKRPSHRGGGGEKSKPSQFKTGRHPQCAKPRN